MTRAYDPDVDSFFQYRLDLWMETRRPEDFIMSLQMDPRSDHKNGDLHHLLDAILEQPGVYGVDVNEPSRRFGQSSVAVATLAQRDGVQGIPHITCRRDHASIVNEVIGAVAHGKLRKVLVMSGDPPNMHLRRMLGRYRRLQNLGITRDIKAAFGEGAEAQAAAAALIERVQFALHNPDGDVLELLTLLEAVRQGKYMGKRSMPAIRFAIGVVYDHTKQGSERDRELDRLRAKRDARANSLWGQPVFTIGQMNDLLESIEGVWDRPVLPGIWALESRQKAQRLNDLVPGVEVPQEIIDQLPDESVPEAERLSVGRRLARELLDQIIAERLCAGAYLVAPLREPWNTLKMLNGH